MKGPIVFLLLGMLACTASTVELPRDTGTPDAETQAGKYCGGKKGKGKCKDPPPPDTVPPPPDTIPPPPDTIPGDYFVSTTGSDTNPGTEGAPWGTLQYALAQLEPGNVLLVRGGTYDENIRNVTIRQGLPGARITVAAYPGERPVLEGLLRLNRPSYWTLDGINVTWGDENGETDHMIKMNNGVGWIWENSEIWGARSFAGMLVYGSIPGEPSDWTVRGNCIHDVWKPGGTVKDHNIYANTGSGSGPGLIERNLLFDALTGSNVKLGFGGSNAGPEDGSAHITVRNNTMVRSVKNVLVTDSTHHAVFERNLIVDASENYAIRAFLLRSTDNVYRDNAFGEFSRGIQYSDAGYDQVQDGGGNLFPVDPQFDGVSCQQLHPQNPTVQPYGRYGDDWVPPPPPAGSLPVIPGAVGFGMDTQAGRGGAVLRVTSLGDNPSSPQPGTLRHALQEEGPRVVVFEVSGTIDLLDQLRIRDPYLTVAGQTAPSPGITLRGDHLSVRTHDVLIQHIRVRTGDLGGGAPDAVQVESFSPDDVYNVVIDHSSFSWAGDENTSTWAHAGARIHDVTFRNLIISEALDASDHSKGMLIGDGNERIAVIGNVFAHNADRNPEWKGGATGVVVNNLIYNWDPSQEATHLGWEEHLPGAPTLLSVVGNAYLRGPDMPLSASAAAVEVYRLAPSNSLLYMNDNVHPDITLFENDASFDPRVSTPPVWVDGLVAQAGSTVENWLLDRAGSRPADRDAVDQRVINEVRTRSGRIIDSQAEVGGWPSLAMNLRTLTLPANPSGDDDGDGYTNLEEWLHSMADQVEGA